MDWPLKEKTHITGTFGELRKSHLHAGIDISTKGKIDLPVYAIAPGTLYRVKTQYIGFGKTVYLILKDGKYLVYAHLNKFSPKIQSTIQQAQNKKEEYVVDIYPKENIYINKGELIGYSGDSGGVAPHLHLELRNKKEQPINIIKHGFPKQKLSPPLIPGLAVCNPEDTSTRKSFKTQKITANKYKIKQPINILQNETLAVAAYNNNHGNKLGIYQINCIIDKKLFFTVKMNRFSYDQFRDNFLAYNKELYLETKQSYYHLFRAFNNNLPFYTLKKDGLLKLAPGKHSLLIEVTDNSGNTSTLTATLISKAIKPATKPKLSNGPWYSKDKIFKLQINAADLYCPLNLNITVTKPQNYSKELIPCSKSYKVNPQAAIFKKATLLIKTNTPNQYLGLYSWNGKKWNFITKGNTGNCRTFTEFCLFTDKTPPQIKIITTSPNFKAKITDHGSGLAYNKLALSIDDRKVIPEYSVNKKTMVYKYPPNLAKGKHKLICTAVDETGNINNKVLLLKL